MTTRTAARAALAILPGLFIGVALAVTAAASPRSYHVKGLLEEGLPPWREGRAPSATQPKAEPLRTLPEMPSPTLRPATELQSAPTAPTRSTRSEDVPRSKSSGAWGR